MRTASLIALALFVAVASASPIGTDRGARAGQEEALPEGVGWQELAKGETTLLPSLPASLSLEWLTIEPGASGDVRPAQGLILLAVESGSVIVGDELGIEGVYEAGAHLFLPANAVYRLRNDGAQPAVVFRMTVAASADGAAPSAAQPGSSEILFVGDIETFPEPPAQLFLARMTLQPGVDLGAPTFAGPVGVQTEQGALSITGPSGTEEPLPAGAGRLLPVSGPSRIRNAGEAVARALVFGMLPASDTALLRFTRAAVDPTAESAPTQSPTEPPATPSAIPTMTPAAATATPTAAPPAPTATSLPEAAADRLLANIVAGECGELGAPVSPLADLALPDAAASESGGHVVAVTTSVAPVLLPNLIAGSHVITIDTPGEPTRTVACGEIVGTPDERNDLFIALRPAMGSTAAGVAWLHDYGYSTSVTTFLAPGLATPGAADASAPRPPIAAIITDGRCEAPGEQIARLADLEPADAASGSPRPVSVSTTTVAISLPDLLGSRVVGYEEGELDRPAVCGLVAGAPDEQGDLFLALPAIGDGGTFGFAWLHDNGDGSTTVVVFVT